ncbi:MAG: tripartite tricarboxylate transporter substrate binding protein [Burkholderiales bacterium]|nr:tripartite tricarboxylate transporter substrate binding protein [Burkholderiales bacterium]
MHFLVRSLVVPTLCFAGVALAQAPAYPAKPVRLVLGPGPGSVADGLTRVMAAAMSEMWSQQVVVENRSGAGNTIAPAVVAKSAPDGYTLHRCGVGDSIAPALYKSLPYSHLRDFAILARIGLTPNILVIHPSIPARNLKEFIALARSQPGKLDYGTTGMGSSPQLSFELFKSMTKTDITFVPYKSAALAQNDLLAGRIASQMSNLPNHIATVREGKVRALGITTAKRSARLPEVPSIAEAGLPGYDVSSWYGICAPIGVDKAILAKIEADVLKLLATAQLKQRLTAMGVDVEPLDSAGFTAFFRAETERWAKTARAAGIKPQ